MHGADDLLHGDALGDRRPGPFLVRRTPGCRRRRRVAASAAPAVSANNAAAEQPQRAAAGRWQRAVTITGVAPTARLDVDAVVVGVVPLAATVVDVVSSSTVTSRATDCGSPLGSSPVTSIVCTPGSVSAGMVTTFVNAPSASTVAEPRSTGSECSVRSTLESGIQPTPLTSTLPPGCTESVSRSAGATVVVVVVVGGGDVVVVVALVVVVVGASSWWSWSPGRGRRRGRRQRRRGGRGRLGRGRRRRQRRRGRGRGRGRGRCGQQCVGGRRHRHRRGRRGRHGDGRGRRRRGNVVVDVDVVAGVAAGSISVRNAWSPVTARLFVDTRI